MSFLMQKMLIAFILRLPCILWICSSIFRHHFFSTFWRMSMCEDIWTCVYVPVLPKMLVLSFTSAFLSAQHMCICETWMFLCVRMSQRLFSPQLLKLWNWHNQNFLCPLQNTSKRNSLLMLWVTESRVSYWGFDHVFSVVAMSCFSGF